MYHIYENNDDYGQWVGVSDFGIEIKGMNGSAHLFANARNMVAVNVYIKPIDLNGKAISISNSNILKHVSLIDYDTGEEILMDQQTWKYDVPRWSYTTTPNEFTELPDIYHSSTKKLTAEFNAELATTNMVTFYVYCFQTEAIKIGVFIKTPSGHEYTTRDNESKQSGFNSYIQLIGVPKIIYSTNNLEIKSYPSNQDDDNDDEHSWEYHNIYISCKESLLHGKRRIIKSEAHKIEKPIDAKPGRKYDFEFDSPYSYYRGYEYSPNSGSDFILHYLWNLSPVRDVQLGDHIGLPDFKLHIDITATINEVPGALCITVLYLSNIIGDLGPYIGVSPISIYDQYGNRGSFVINSYFDTNYYDIQLKPVSIDSDC
ncbi:hypothetical protein FE394_00550 [Xenorhabdus sp. Reich]|uniref:Toxin n=1 Tax=Xenorhabdus littoralis TaxID=2582835 RepID=A0ABU4SGH0_9GAMM|nr:hypothetical protein [Xenorhabdus sp. Reich]MDX7997723.1 hypothetical protein [Xenorhabdus sp. Reich]